MMTQKPSGKRGRPVDPASMRSMAKQIRDPQDGKLKSEATIRRRFAVASAGDRYPILQKGKGFSPIIRAAAVLDSLPRGAREAALAGLEVGDPVQAIAELARQWVPPARVERVRAKAAAAADELDRLQAANWLRPNHESMSLQLAASGLAQAVEYLDAVLAGRDPFSSDEAA